MPSTVLPSIYLLLLLRQHSSATYTSCANRRYGMQCQHLCQCNESEDCDDGPLGSGDCSPVLNILDLPSDDERRSTFAQTSPFLSNFHLQTTTFDQKIMDNQTHRLSRQVYNASGARILPMPFKQVNLDLIGIDPIISQHLGLFLPTTKLSKRQEQDVANAMSGRILLPGSVTFAHAYCGHQFGNWAGQLGDGRATTIGNRLSPVDESSYELSLKGSGRTAFSRSGDGRAVLRNLVREYLSGIFLTSVGVPATSALALVGSDDNVDGIYRDEYYTGRPEKVRPGVLVRVSPSFARFGSFQFAIKRQGYNGVLRLSKHVLSIIAEQEHVGDRSYQAHFRKSPNVLHQHFNKTIQQQCFFAPNMNTCTASTTANMSSREILKCTYDRIAMRTASLIASWQSIGFTHGVMNTDNMAAIGITMDMNVFGLIDEYTNQANEFTANYIDDGRRYKFGNQPTMGEWNLKRLGDVFLGKRRFVGEDRGNKRGAIDGDGDDGSRWLSNVYIIKKIKQYRQRYTLCYQERLKWRVGLIDINVVRSWMSFMDYAHLDFHAGLRILGEMNDELTIEKNFQKIANIVPTTNMKQISKIKNKFSTVFTNIQKAVHNVYGNDINSWNKWRKHIRSVNPRMIMRTSALKEIGEIVESGNNDALLHSMNILRDPFWTNGFNTDFDNNRHEEKIMKDPLYAHIRRLLSSLPSKEEKNMQTSCGGQ
jgi:uncharacterized protein YdiU (UPF0061 family)